MLVAFLLFGAGCGCTMPRQRTADPELFTKKLHEVAKAWERAKVWHSPDIEQEAKWFKPYYKQLIEMLATDRDRNLLAVMIIMQHGRPYAIRTLEPFLKSMKGEELKWTAILLYESSYGLHPQARTALKGMPDDHDAARRLRFPEAHPELHAADQEKASRAAGVELSVWKTLSKEQKWEKLKKVWDLK